MPHFDFIDIGSSKGGSMRFAMRHFGVKGYGIDIDPRKVQIAQNAGFAVRCMNIHEVEDTAEWCTCLHVIEHLSGREEAREMIAAMCKIASNVLLTFPYFDADGFLYDEGLKFFWSDWSGHPYHCTRLELHNILRDLGVNFRIEAWGDISREIISINAPKDSFGGEHSYDSSHLPLFKETRCAIGDTSILDRI